MNQEDLKAKLRTAELESRRMRMTQLLAQVERLVNLNDEVLDKEDIAANEEALWRVRTAKALQDRAMYGECRTYFGGYWKRLFAAILNR